MNLLTKAITGKLPVHGSTDGQGEEAIAQVKLFTPWTGWTWYGIEYDPEREEMYGLTVSPSEQELGTFSLAELRAIKGPFFLKIERDIYFTPKTIGECRKRHEIEGDGIVRRGA